MAFTRGMAPFVLQNVDEAVDVYLATLNGAVGTLLAEMPAEQRAELVVLVTGVHQARIDNAAMQYFDRLLGNPPAIAQRLIYAENIRDERGALHLLGIHVMARRVGTAFFQDPTVHEQRPVRPRGEEVRAGDDAPGAGAGKAGAGWTRVEPWRSPRRSKQGRLPAGSGRGIAAEVGVTASKGRIGAPKALDAAALQTSIDAGYLPTYEGDPTRNDSYRAYGEPLLAVADGTVVTVSSGARDEQPQVVPTGLSAANSAGTPSCSTSATVCSPSTPTSTST